MPDQLPVGDALTGNARQHLAEPAAVVLLPLVEAERLLDHVAVKVERLDAHVSPLERPLEQAPEVLQAVRVDGAAHILDRVIDRRMHILRGEAAIARVRIGEQFRAGLDRSLDHCVQRVGRGVRNVPGNNLARFCLAAPPQDAHDDDLAGAARAGDLLRPTRLCMFFARPPMNVSSASAGPLSFRNEPVSIASRMRCSMNHAVFCVTPIARWIS